MSKKPLSDQELIDKYHEEYTSWFNVLNKYHTNRFDRNYKQYTAYTAKTPTSSKISDPVAPELVEKVVQKLFERDPKFYVLGRGVNIPKEITDIITATASYFWSNPEAIDSSGPKKPKLKMAGREFCVIGQTATETYFDSESDNPDFRVIPIEDIIFDPTKSLRTSKIHYIRTYVSFQELLANKENYKNLDRLKASIDTEQHLKTDDSKNKIKRSGSELYQDQVNQIELISRWEDNKLCQMVNWEVIIREEEDPLGIGVCPLNFAMDIEVAKQPYAFSWLDFINGLTKAKDLILNQTLDYGAKALNPPLFVDPNISPVNRATLSNAWRLGGIVMASPQSADHKQMPPLPPVSFEMMNYLQQRSESTSGIGAYLSGVPNQVSDKTKGTKGGIQMMLQQATSPVADRQQNLEESLIEPMVNKWLKMAGRMMGSNETKFVFISGQSPKWVKITKGLLTGKIKLDDLLTAELMEPEEIEEISQSMLTEGKDPTKELVFDVDWIVRVETGSMAETDTEKEIESFDGWVQQALAMGKQLDLDKVLMERGIKAGIKEPDQYFAQTPQGMPGQVPNQPQPSPPMVAANLMKK